MKQLEGFEAEDKKCYVYKLNKSLYGPKQTPMQWNFGFERSKHDTCVYSSF